MLTCQGTSQRGPATSPNSFRKRSGILPDSLRNSLKPWQPPVAKTPFLIRSRCFIMGALCTKPCDVLPHGVEIGARPHKLVQLAPDLTLLAMHPHIHTHTTHAPHPTHPPTHPTHPPHPPTRCFAIGSFSGFIAVCILILICTNDAKSDQPSQWFFWGGSGFRNIRQNMKGATVMYLIQ